MQGMSVLEPGFLVENLPLAVFGGDRTFRHYGPGDSFFLDLQFFAAEDEGRTEEPTESKKRKAREEGKVPKSQDISAALVLLFTFWGISLFGHFILSGFQDAFHYFIGGVNNITLSVDNMRAYVIQAMLFFFRIMAPIALIAVLVAVLSNVVQVGFLFTFKPIKPDFSRIAFTPKKLMERVLISKQTAMNLFKSVVKIGGAGLIAFFIIRGDLAKLLNLANIGVLQGMNEVTVIAFKLVNAICLALIALAIPDYIFQRRQHLESLRMSIPEVKEERKQEEGDPFVRQRIMQKSRELAQRNLPANVKAADVVITNPTHIAVALKYDLHANREPIVAAKGADHLAFRIRQLATDAGIPLVENKPLAWALYTDIEVGDPIPEQLFEAVAVIYSRLSAYQAASA